MVKKKKNKSNKESSKNKEIRGYEKVKKALIELMKYRP